MRIIWTLIALATMAALYIIYQMNRPRDDRPIDIIANCPDSYPAVVTTGELSDEGAKVTVSCKPDRFIRRHVPEHSL